MTRLAINCIPLLTRMTGVGRCLWETASRLDLGPDFETEYFYHYFDRKLYSLDPASPGFGRLSGLERFLSRRSLPRRVYVKVRRIAAPIGKRRFDVYYEPNFIPHPLIQAKRIAAVVHDFSFMLHPQWHPKARVAHFKKAFKTGIGRADVVIVVSEAIRQEALSILRHKPENIRTIHNGVDHAIFLPKPGAVVAQALAARGMEKPYLLFVGTMEPRKNLAGLFAAWKRLPRRIKDDYELVVAGDGGWKSHAEREAAQSLPGVRLLGYVGDAELAALYSGARLFVWPSFYEGFGIPPLEALACGAPLLASDIAVNRELFGDVARFVDPADPDSISAGIEAELDDEAGLALRKERGIAHAARFTWERTAGACGAIFKELR